jgi:hypothetical protein
MGTLLGNIKVDFLTGDTEGKMNFQGWDVEGSVDGCLGRGPVGEPGEGVLLQGTVRGSGRRAPEMEHLCLRELSLGNQEV